MHSVFNVERNKVLELVDEAWLKRGEALVDDPGAYVIDMGQVVGKNGETAIKIAVKIGTTDVLSAYPIKGGLL